MVVVEIKSNHLLIIVGEIRDNHFIFMAMGMKPLFNTNFYLCRKVVNKCLFDEQN